MAYPIASEFTAWLSGGTGNTSPAASLGGARSTVQRTGRFIPLGGAFPYVLYGGITINEAWNIQNEWALELVNLPWTGSAWDDPAVFALSAYGNSGNQLSVSGPSGTGGTSLFENGTGGTYIQQWADIDVAYASLTTGPLGTGSTGAPTSVQLDADEDNLVDVVSRFTAGTSIYRCFFIQNDGAATAAQLDFGSDFHGASEIDSLSVEIGLGVGGVDGFDGVIPDQETAPSGVTFSSTGVQVTVPALNPGSNHPMWLRLNIPASFAPTTTYDRIIVHGVDTDGLEAQVPTYAYAFRWSYAMEGITDSITIDEANSGIGRFYELSTGTFSLTSTGGGSARIYELMTGTLDFTEGGPSGGSGGSGTGLAAGFAHVGRMYGVIEDELELADAILENMTMGVAVEDSLVLEAELNINNEILKGWVLNVDTKAPSLYEWAAFNSFTEYRGQYYGATPEGIALLDGDDDEGADIDAYIGVGSSDLGVEQKKRPDRAYVGHRTDGTMLLKTVDDDGNINVYSLTVTPGKEAMMASRRFPFGRGAESQYWKFALQNEDGADFEAESIQIFPVVLLKKHR